MKLIAAGDERTLRKRPDHSPESSPDKPALLYLAFDGVNRDQLYAMLRAGELPQLANLLGGAEGGKLVHAHMDDRLLSTMPSSTMPAWVTTMTGLPPAEHGVTGNEYFIRESRTFACPAPVTFESAAPTISIYTDGYLDALMPIGAYLAEHPHPSYIAMEERLHDLAAGKRGERAGDVLLIAHNGEAKTPASATTSRRRIARGTGRRRSRTPRSRSSSRTRRSRSRRSPRGSEPCSAIVRTSRRSPTCSSVSANAPGRSSARHSPRAPRMSVCAAEGRVCTAHRHARDRATGGAGRRDAEHEGRGASFPSTQHVFPV